MLIFDKFKFHSDFVYFLAFDFLLVEFKCRALKSQLMF